jgi:D-alanine-D-alanine ligase
MRIALLANLKENAPATEAAGADLWDDLDSPETINSILGALESAGHRTEFFEASILPPHNLLERLESYKPELCFNIAESHFGDGREAQIPALLETLRLPYTGSGVLTLALALDKPMTKRILHYHELPTPEFQVFGRPDEEINDDLLSGDALKFPLFVKPSREGTGMGVSGRSIVSTVAELRERLAEMLETYRQPILCERFIRGREITVGLVGNLAPTAARRLNDRTAPAVLPPELALLPPMEIEMEKYDESERGVYTNRIKVELVHDFHYRCPAEIDDELRRRLFGLSAAVFRVTGGRDVSRIDFRIDESDGTPYILETNPLPGLNPEYSDLCIEAYAAGWSFEELINRIVDLAAERYEIGEPTV